MFYLTNQEELLKKARKLQDEENFEEALEISENLILTEPENDSIKNWPAHFFIKLVVDFSRF